MSGFHRLHALRMENDAAGFAMDEMRPRFERMANRHENGTAPRAVSVFQLFQTPPEVAARLVALLDVRPGSRILEPSAGLGRLLDAVQPLQPSEVVAVEIAPECAGELFRQDRPGVTIKQRDFLTVSPSELGLFDAVVMNPPFRMGSDVKHIRHAFGFLKQGGQLVSVCSATTGQKLKDWAAVFGGAVEPLPSGSFRSSNTGVETAILTAWKL